MSKVRGKEKRGRKIYLTTVLMLLISIFAFTSVTFAASTTPALSKKKATLYQGGQLKLKLKRASAKKVSWISENEEIAEVSDTGMVTAVASGKCKIKAVYKKKTYSCTVTVKKLKLDKKRLSLVTFRQGKLKLNTTKVKVLWSSSNPDIAAVTKTGLVKAKRSGTCVISAKYKAHVMSCKVTVLPATVKNLCSTSAAEKNQKKIVLAGSSTLDYWAGAYNAFSPYSIVNNAIGGTTVTYWLNHYEELIVDYNPSAVVIYVGANDIGNGNWKTGSDTAADAILLLKKLSSSLKKIPIYYISVCPCPGRPEAGEEISVCNAKIKKWCSAKPYVYYLNAASYVSKDGEAYEKYYLSDGLHPNNAGYAVWKKRVAQVVVRSLKKKGIKY